MSKASSFSDKQSAMGQPQHCSRRFCVAQMLQERCAVEKISSMVTASSSRLTPISSNLVIGCSLLCIQFWGVKKPEGKPRAKSCGYVFIVYRLDDDEFFVLSIKPTAMTVFSTPIADAVAVVPIRNGIVKFNKDTVDPKSDDGSFFVFYLRIIPDIFDTSADRRVCRVAQKKPPSLSYGVKFLFDIRFA